jgi:hypothetical protein
MSDIISSFDPNKNVQRFVATYLITLEPIKGKNQETYFLTNKVEETAYYVRATGFFADVDLATIIEKHAGITKENTHDTEAMFPWGRVVNIRNLSYRPKSK